MTNTKSSAPVAIVGMALRVPGANTVSEFWDLVREGRSAITRFTADDAIKEGVPVAVATDRDYVPAHGVLDGAEEFDAEFFGYAPREASLTDPQHRKFLECAVEALEDAGHGRQEDGQRFGVVAGTGANTYLLNNVLSQPRTLEDISETALLVSSEKDHLATRTAHRLDLHGPAFTVQTSCSTSLVAVHLACQALRGGEADLMLAGGVTIQAPQRNGYIYSPGGIASPDGVCRAFDAGASGTVFGSGVVVFALRRLHDALDDADRVIAVIRSSAVNNDGGRKVGYTAPSVAGQVAVLRAAHAAAGLRSSDIGYVESHGTGTELGDAIEVEALREVFQQEHAQSSCGLGTLKPNIGHLDCAAGAAGLAKAALVVERGVIPPNAHFDTVNPSLNLEDTPFILSTSPRPWEAETRRAGVSAFGIGGSNVHVVIEQAPLPAERPHDPEPQVFPVSARTPEQARALAVRVSRWWQQHPDVPGQDVAFTLHEGRRLHQWRVAVAASDASTYADQIAVTAPVQARRTHRVGFAFTGFGTQWPGMLRGVAQRFPVVRETIDECAELFPGAHRDDILALTSSRGDAGKFHSPLVGQMVAFAASLAMARLFGRLGARAQFVMGHSLGEYGAACVAGALSTADAVRLVTTRAGIFDEMPVGAMTAVLADLDAVRNALSEGAEIAAVNAADSIVITGCVESIESTEARLLADGVRIRRLPIAVAAHSAALDPMMDAFTQVAAAVTSSPLTIPMVSSVDGRWVAEGTRLPEDYWVRHLRQPVQFFAAARAVVTSPALTLEMGAGETLTNLLRKSDSSQHLSAISTLPDAEDAGDPVAAVLRAAGEAWSRGVPMDGRALRGGSVSARRVSLPAYPFARHRHWIDVSSDADASTTVPPGVAIGGTTPPREVATTIAPPRLIADGASRHLHDIAQLWAELLGRPVAADCTDNFFSLGGDSLLLVQLVARLRRQYSVSVPLRAVAANATLAALAAMVDGVVQTDGEVERP